MTECKSDKGIVQRQIMLKYSFSAEENAKDRSKVGATNTVVIVTSRYTSTKLGER